ncbi:hypothetical protein AGMMS50255_7610 [Spirochaetia bacterium]|nr:hypothetical protein AGMMS50255_7610 [Spirochaetia bacterium]
MQGIVGPARLLKDHADEPTTALDVTIQKQIVTLLKKLRENRGISIIFISHDIDLVAEISDRIMVMYGGLVMESGPVGLFTAGISAGIAGIPGKNETGAGTQGPAHPYTQALLAASPHFGKHYSQVRLLTIPGKVTDPSSPPPGCPFGPRCAKAVPECSKGIPPLQIIEETHEIRCILCNQTESNT